MNELPNGLLRQAIVAQLNAIAITQTNIAPLQSAIGLLLSNITALAVTILWTSGLMASIHLELGSFN